jgi:D-alanyl-lipoteichoic acid acyltransferase DltB (MBOAT superfamily)
MLFNSYEFWVFLAVVLLLYRALPHRGQNRMLLVASYVFYGAWDWRFLSLILTSTVVSYVSGRGTRKATSQAGRRGFLLLSLVTNLGILCAFKYYDFFARELTGLGETFGLSLDLPILHVILPVGISFYTFQTLSYSIDVYRGETKPEESFPDFALYVAFFPQLVAGPIERSSRLLPQVLRRRSVSFEDFRVGLHLVLLGLFKKVVIADNMAPIVNAVFSKPTDELTGLECLIGVYAFAFQIYGDFSGYSSIAKGVARWMGFDIMTNFSMPYLATSPQDFWRRWHISLSTWLRDYLYVPLGGNRGTRASTYRNLITTMLLGGLWHGAAWTFVIWGLFHGVWLALHRLLQERRESRSSRPPRPATRWLRVIGTFHLVCVGWLFFRAESLTQAWTMILTILTDQQVSQFAVASFAMMAFLVLPLFVYEMWLHRGASREPRDPQHWLPRGAIYAYCVSMLIFFPPPVTHEFIYFQF